MDSTRVIILTDADCFEVQIYQQLDPSSKGKPCVVTNSSGRIVAVSYEAKSYGISREDFTFQKAKLKCKSLVNLKIPEADDGSPDYKLQRKVTNDIVTAIKEFCKEKQVCTPIFEYSSRDEFYLDVTALVDAIIKQQGLIFPTRYLQELWPNSFIETEDGPLNPQNWISYQLDDIKLFYGLVIGSQIVEKVKTLTGYQLSAGIGTNKLVAKLACGLNKPAAVTMLLPNALAQVGERVKIEDIFGLGGKIGESIKESLHVKVMNDLASSSITVNDISIAGKITMKKAEEIYNAVRGICTKPVTAKEAADSIMVTKQYNRGTKLDLSQLMEEIRIKLDVMLVRADEEYHWKHRVPMSIKLTIKRYGKETISKRLKYPIEHQNAYELLDMFIHKMKLDEEWEENGEPLSSIAIVAQPFVSSGNNFP